MTTIKNNDLQRSSKRFGAPQDGGKLLDKKSSSRFWSKVEIGLPDGCWNWLASKHQFGYGVFWQTFNFAVHPASVSKAPAL